MVESRRPVGGDNPADGEITIQIRGSRRRELLNQLRHEFDRISGSGVDSSQFVSHDGEDWVAVARLADATLVGKVVTEGKQVLDVQPFRFLLHHDSDIRLDPKDSSIEPRQRQSEPPKTMAAAQFDTFLSHNSQDKPIVRELADALVARGLRPWLDERELVPGRPWQEALEQIIRTTKTAAVMFGPAGLGPWEEPEMRASLSEFVERQLPVIPVLLPRAPESPTSLCFSNPSRGLIYETA